MVFALVVEHSETVCLVVVRGANAVKDGLQLLEIALYFVHEVAGTHLTSVLL